jgi:tubulin--tyrosine ligase
MLAFINSKNANTLCVVQKYIERPLLYRGRKFDIRVWALVNTTSEVYFYKQGYLRTSSSVYDLEEKDY